MYTGQILRTVSPYKYGWECSCGERKAPYTNMFSQVEGDLDAHVRTHDKETAEEDERFVNFEAKAPNVVRITPLNERIWVHKFLVHYEDMVFERGAHHMYLKGSDVTGKWWWRCTCGGVGDTVSPSKGMVSAKETAAQRALDHIERQHHDHNLSTNRADSVSVPIVPVDAQRTDDAHSHVEDAGTRSQDPKSSNAIAVIGDGGRIIEGHDTRWGLFDDKEITAIFLSCREGHRMYRDLPKRAPLTAELSDEMRRRSLPLNP
jgi:hypothetical protein